VRHCSCDIPIRRAWAMPSAETFSIPPIAELLDRWLEGREVIVDPFARNSKRGTITNDLSSKTTARFSLESREFLRAMHADQLSADAALLDPPYSPRQIKDCYEGVGMPVGQCETQHARLISDVKDLLAPLVRPGGIVVTCGWNSQGMGRCRRFELREVLIVAHGGSHNDTIVTVEEKMPSLFDGFQGSAVAAEGARPAGED